MKVRVMEPSRKSTTRLLSLLLSSSALCGVGNAQKAIAIATVPGTTYNFQISSTNFRGGTPKSLNFSFKTTRTAPPAGQPAVSNVAAATGAQSLGSSSTYDNTLVTARPVTLTGLTSGTTYHYSAKSASTAAKTPSSSTIAMFATSAEAAGPVLTNIASYPVASTTATILWTSSVNATSVVNFGRTTAYGSQATQPGLGLYHKVPLSGLTPNTTYHYQAVSTNAAGGTTKSVDFAFKTAP